MTFCDYNKRYKNKLISWHDKINHYYILLVKREWVKKNTQTTSTIVIAQLSSISTSIFPYILFWI